MRRLITTDLFSNGNGVPRYTGNETEGRVSAEGVSVRHKPDDAAEWEGVLGCAVHQMAPWNGVYR